MKIGIVIGTTREGRKSPLVAQWLKEYGDSRKDATYELIDIKTYKLPFLGDEDVHNGVEKWNKKLFEFDGFIFLTGEYNHSIPAVLKNSLDIANRDVFTNKAAGIVSYGSLGGARSTEHLRSVLSELAVAHVRTHPAFSIFLDFNNNQFVPRDVQLGPVKQMFDDVILWTKAMNTIRTA